jgi:hypothetical protein
MSVRRANRRGLPARVGSLSAQSALRLAESAIAQAGVASSTAKRKFAVTLDPNGVVWVDHMGDANERELIAVIDRKSDPDWLEGEIAHEWVQREKKFVRVRALNHPRFA